MKHPIYHPSKNEAEIQPTVPILGRGSLSALPPANFSDCRILYLLRRKASFEEPCSKSNGFLHSGSNRDLRESAANGRFFMSFSADAFFLIVLKNVRRQEPAGSWSSVLSRLRERSHNAFHDRHADGISYLSSDFRNPGSTKLPYFLRQTPCFPPSSSLTL